MDNIFPKPIKLTLKDKKKPEIGFLEHSSNETPNTMKGDREGAFALKKLHC